MCIFLWFPHVCFQKRVSFRVIAVSCRSKGVTFFLNQEIHACHCRVVSVGRGCPCNKHPLGKWVSNISTPYKRVGCFLDNPCACHFVSILISLLKIRKHFTSDTKSHVHFFSPKMKSGAPQMPIGVGLVDFGLELIIFQCAISMNAKGCPLGTP